MSDLNKLTIAGARDGLRRGDFTAVELTEASLAAAEASEKLNAYSAITADQAREMAAAADVRLAASASKRVARRPPQSIMGASNDSPRSRRPSCTD